MDFQPFNPAGKVDITRKLLPHWQQERRTYFITWRTADSFPAFLLKQWQVERDAWLLAHHTSVGMLEHLPPEKRREYHDRFSKRWQDHLDEGHGDCVLRQADARAIVEGVLRHFDGARYALGDFVLMPNHVHVIVSPAADEDIKAICASWKRFSGRQINQLMGKHGEFWQTESFDHIVRHLPALRKTQQYVAENPAKAHLRKDKYTLYQPAGWQEGC